MSDTNSRLWPYGVVLALAAVPAIFALFTALIFTIEALLHWPALRNESAVLYFSFALSLLPIFLVLLDFVALKRAVIGNKWLNLIAGQFAIFGGWNEALVPRIQARQPPAAPTIARLQRL